jgi:hypothetical protein
MSVSCECCVFQLEVSATSCSLVQRSPTECGVSKTFVIVKPRKMRRPRPPRGCRAIGKKRESKHNDKYGGVKVGMHICQQS